MSEDARIREIARRARQGDPDAERALVLAQVRTGRAQFFWAVVGSREGVDEALVRSAIRQLPEGVGVVSGGARGVDSWALDEAEKLHRDTKVIRPCAVEFEAFGERGAFLARNLRIVDEASRVLAFWDGDSGGTLDAMRKASALGRRCFVFVGGRIERVVLGGYAWTPRDCWICNGRGRISRQYFDRVAIRPCTHKPETFCPETA